MTAGRGAVRNHALGISCAEKPYVTRDYLILHGLLNYDVTAVHFTFTVTDLIIFGQELKIRRHQTPCTFHHLIRDPNTATTMKLLNHL